MLKALFPGSFDPPTNGHINIIERATKIFDELEIVISINVQKSYLFQPEERFSMMSELVQGYDNVRVHLWDKIIVDFADKVLRQDGDLLVKLFQGEGFDDLLRVLRAGYQKVKIRKPKASRPRSREVYALARGKKV